MRLMHVYEPISVRLSSRSPVPAAFTWRKQHHRVRVIEGVADDGITQLEGTVLRRTYKLRTYTGMRCSVSYDERKQTWRLDSVRAQGGIG